MARELRRHDGLGAFVLQVSPIFGVLIIAAAVADPFAFLRPTVTLNSVDLRKLEMGEAMARVVPAGKGEVAMAGIVKVSVDGERLVAWYREIEALKKSQFVAQIGRFSNPPRIEDLEPLTLDEGDLDDIRRCTPGDCGLKLSDGEISHLREADAHAARAQELTAVQRAFRQILVRRVQAHLDEGAQRTPEPPKFLTLNWPQVLSSIERHSLPGIETLLYWSKERLGRGKPMISVTKLSIVRGHGESLPDPIVIGHQLFATHYVDASWSVTTITPGGDGSKYLVYVNQSEVDLLGGLFGGIVRAGIQRQLRGQAGGQLRALKQRLEGGYPPVRAAQFDRTN
jgi:hypothetical protein